jgi:hypothetical protein
LVFSNNFLTNSSSFRSYGIISFFSMENNSSVHSNFVFLPVYRFNVGLNGACPLNVIATFLWLSLGRYLCWWTISSRGYHPSVISWHGLLVIFIIEIQ